MTASQEVIVSGGVRLRLNWPQAPEDIRTDAKRLWAANNALLPSVDPDDRAAQIVAIADDVETTQILGVATVQPEFMDWIGCHMYRYRTFAIQDARLRRISLEMLNKTFEFLADLTHDTDEAAGLYMEVENRQLMKHQNEGIWFESRCAFIGRTPEGWHRRVRYFPHAQLTTNSRPGPLK